MNAYNILTGTGTLYIAPTGTAFPAVDAAPASPWRSVGETQDGVEIEIEEDYEEISTDQRTGNVAVVRTKEVVTISCKLVEATLENLADVLGVDVTAGTGEKSMPLYRGGTVTEWAAVYRGKSPYADANGQWQFPRGYFSIEGPLAHKKDEPVMYEIKFHLLEDLSAASTAERHGKWVAETS